MYLRRKIGNLDCEAQINRIEINNSTAVATEAQKELDIAKYLAEKLSGVVTDLQRRLDNLEDQGSNGSHRSHALQLGTNNS